MRRLVIVGDFLGQGSAGHGSYEEDGNVFAKCVGLAEERNGMHVVIPLTGIYNPKKGDGIIGKIQDVVFTRLIVDINAPYQGTLSLSEAVEEFIDLTKTDLSQYFNYGDMIFTEIMTVTQAKSVQLTMKSRTCRKLKGGRLIKVTPAKVPRIIGTKGSMVEMIKELTGTQIVVGQNGLVWIKGEKEALAAEAILQIEKKSHVSGLTDQIKEMLSS